MAEGPIVKVTECIGHHSGLLIKVWIAAGMHVEFCNVLYICGGRCSMADMHLRHMSTVLVVLGVIWA